ncbi:MAG TPA: VIT1/CCC1 transporter family protein [Candidatus Nanoarchaeia archaeon]|nr:VIT1/CCC1 transporter family protein [Candidatus Nanoarchaeia archaeon]
MQNHTKKVNFREFILGGQDGLVNVLGLVLGVASATLNTNIVLISGTVATVAESVSMAAVAYTSSKAAKDYYNSIIKEEEKVWKKKPKIAEKEIREVFERKGFKGKDLDIIVSKICKDKKICVETMLLEEHRMSPAEFESPLRSAWIVGTSTVIGSIIPLLPFFFLSVKTGIITSLVFSAIMLFIVGVLKARLSIGSWKRSGLELMIIGIIAALLGYGVGLLLKGYGVVA